MRTRLTTFGSACLLIAIGACNCGTSLGRTLSAITWSPAALRLTTSPGAPTSGKVTLTNTGKTSVQVDSATVTMASRMVFAVVDSAMTLPSGTSATVVVTYTPVTCPPPSLGADNAELTLMTTAANGEDIVIPIVGICVELDAGTPDAGTLSPTACPAPGVSGALSGLRWELPNQETLSMCQCDTSPRQTQTAVLNGPSGTQFLVTLEFRGEVEQKTYSGGTSDGGLWLVGGSPANDSYNIYELDISSPPQTYFLNAGTSGQCTMYLVDELETIPIESGATVTLTADPVDTTEVPNVLPDGGQLVVPGVPPYPQPFDGQFIQMDVISVTPPMLPDAGVSCAVANGGCDPRAICTGIDAGLVNCRCPQALTGDGCSCADAG